MDNDSTKTLSRSSLSFLSGTLISRLTGGIRDMAMAFCFGSSSALAAFMVAYRFASLARRLFGESPIASGFVPHFEDLKTQSAQTAARFFRDTLLMLVFFLLLVIGLTEVVLWIVYQYAPLEESTKEVLYLCLIMLPGVLFICLFGLSSALLQCEKMFFLSGLAPVAFNIVWIVAVFYFRHFAASDAAVGLSLSMLIAFFCHWAILLPKILKYITSSLPIKKILSGPFFTEDVKKMIKPFFLGTLGVGAVQINSVFDALFARYASLEGPAYLWYAIRIQQVPVGIFGVAMASALLPLLSKAATLQDGAEYKRCLIYGMKKSGSLLVPSAIGLFVLGCSGVNLVYCRGGFTSVATSETVLCLWGYAIGLLPSVGVMLLAPAFYAQKKFRTPTLAATISVFFNILLNYLFVTHWGWGALSIALSTSIAAFINFFALSFPLRKDIGPFLSEVLRSSVGTIACTFAAGITTFCIGYFFMSDPTLSLLQGQTDLVFARNLSSQLLTMLVLTGFFLLTLFSYAWIGNVEDLLNLIKIKKRVVQNPL